MANYDYTDLMAQIDAVIYSNESQEIKATNLKQLIIDVVDSGILLVYDPTRNYEPGAFTVYNNGTGYRGYVCTAHTTGTFTPGDWGQIGV